MYKQDLALNNLQELIYHKTQPTNLSTTFKFFFFFKVLIYKIML